MSRSGYSDDYDDHRQLAMWRGAVASAVRGKRGQAFLKEMLAALESRTDRKLISHELENDGAVCAIGAVGIARGVDMANIDPEDHEEVAVQFGISHALACEIMFMNDESTCWYRNEETPEARFERMRSWIQGLIKS
jgi:hypothetical protein